MTNRTKVLFLLLAMLGAISVRAYAQQKTSEKISPKERWAFETQCNGLAVAVAECQSGI